MKHILGVLFFRLSLVLVASAGFVAILDSIHNYPQTRQAISDYEHGDGLFWLVMFYFVNEAGSGIKYEVTGNEKHLGHFPRIDDEGLGNRAWQDYELVHLSAVQGDWREQLRLSHMLALGWGVEADKNMAVRWYRQSEERAKELREHEQWQSFSRRKQVRVLIASELSLGALGEIFAPPWREDESSRSPLRPVGESG